MTKKCECLPGARYVISEIVNTAEHSEPENIVEDGNFISGMLFVIQEAKLVDTVDEFDDILDSVRKKNIDKFRNAALSAARKIEKISC